MGKNKGKKSKYNARDDDAIHIVPDKKIKLQTDQMTKASNALVSAPVPPDKKIKLQTDQMTKASNALVPAPVPLSDSLYPSTSASRTTGNIKEADGKDNEGVDDGYAGFIFMCNNKTKPECYQYGVFGLPAGNKGVVEKIRPGAKLFLFDFQLKLLFGIYEASTVGKLNLEPAAFGGNFPAQVRFRIHKDCLPLPESSFRNAIKDNYQGSKFKPALSSQQVRNLSSLYRPFNPALAELVPDVAPQAWSTMNGRSSPSTGIPTDKDQYVSPQPWLSMNNHVRPSTGFPSHKDPYVAHIASQPWLTQPIERRELSSQHGFYGASATIDPDHLAAGQQYMQAPHDLHHLLESRGLYVADDFSDFRGSFRRELSSQHGLYGASATIDPDHLAAGHQYKQAPRDLHHLPESRGPYVADDSADFRGSFYRELSSQHGLYGASATIYPDHLAAGHRYMQTSRDLHHSPESRGPYVADDSADFRGSFDRSYERSPTITEDVHLRYPSQRENFGGHYNPYTMYGTSGHSVVMQQPHASSSRRIGSLERILPISSYYTFEGATRIKR